MEKVVALLRVADHDENWCQRQRGPVAEAILALGVAGLAVNVRDAAVTHSMMTLTTLDPPGAAVVSIWTQQCYGEQIGEALRLLAAECDQLAAYLVTESNPLLAPLELGRRTTGLANIALLRRPPELDYDSWLRRWQHDHTPVAIETQSTFGYTQNAVVRALTPDAPRLAGIVEELFPIEAIADLKAFFGAADDADLQQRLSRMVASTTAFGANANIDTIPTSRYVLTTPFHTRGDAGDTAN
ncbi:EthD domain-containing protein [Mycobacterium paraterrae]|uniref:EthD domain-containing protein n=1 Tax=Mycobacterium paraterrae TaxID=577492 RepID=A0ABY3VWM7_9MYCO|nr:EthD domain-containing protein [Mycobacterium paraterrae]UMB71962.1 EthD domain-containing protein [Mycobacterium paraterrae]